MISLEKKRGRINLLWRFCWDWYVSKIRGVSYPTSWF